MKRHLLIALVGIVLISTIVFLLNSHAAENAIPVGYEYTTIRWGGRDNTHVIRPNGEVEFVGSQLRNFRRPDRADDRSFHMNIVMNGLAKEGWELAAMTPDDIVMRRMRK